MLKYVNTDVVFQEIPDEVSLAINISGCPCRCPGCHSHYLWEDIGLPLDTDAVDDFVGHLSADITCIAFMGGDSDPMGVNLLAQYIHVVFLYSNPLYPCLNSPFQLWVQKNYQAQK